MVSLRARRYKCCVSVMLCYGVSHNVYMLMLAVLLSQCKYHHQRFCLVCLGRQVNQRMHSIYIHCFPIFLNILSIFLLLLFADKS